MDHCPKLVAALLLAFSGVANAGYAQVSPPVNWSESAGKFFYKAAANDVAFSGGVRGAAAGVLNVGGRAVVMPAAYRFASNAGVFVARAAFINPLWFVGAGVAFAAYGHFTQSGYNVENGVWMKTLDGLECSGGTCKEYSFYPPDGLWGTSMARAAASYEGTKYCGPGCRLVSVGPFDAARWHFKRVTLSDGSDAGNLYVAPGIRTVPESSVAHVRPATEQEFEQEIAPKPLPLTLPQQWPQPLPVESPILNPSPGTNPFSQPLRSPMGEPQRVPNSDPAQWRTPVIDIVPSPTPSDPWRVDVQPKDIIKEDATPLPDSEPVPDTNPDGQTEEEKQPDLCEKNPDILACQKPELGTVEPETVVDKERALAINKDSGWGPENGSCPAPKTAQVLGITLSMPFTMLCDFALGIRPLLIAFAWLSAIGGFIGIGRKE